MQHFPSSALEPTPAPLLIRKHLDAAHASVVGGDPSGALQHVLAALQITGGGQAAMPALQRVLAQIVGEHSGETNPGGGSSSSHEALAQLSSLFASISIAPDTAGQNSACTSTTSVPSIPAAGPSNTAGLPQGAGLPFQRRTPSQPIPFMQRPQVPSTQGTGQGSQGQRSPGSSMELGSPSQGQPGAWIPGWHASTSTAGSTAHATAGAGLVLPGLPCCGVSQGSGAGAGGSCELQGQQQGLLGGGTAPILVETGREGLASCALADGSHYCCPGCGGVVPFARRAHHEQHWCPAAHGRMTP